MENWCRLGCSKFFRGLIASRQPEEIIKLVERYNDNKRVKLCQTWRLVGSFSYQHNMPMNSIKLVGIMDGEQTKNWVAVNL